MKKKVLAIAGLVLALALVFFLNQGTGDNTQQLSEEMLKCEDCNVLIIGFDALQANHVGHLGYYRDTTPTLDKLAAEGVSFSQNFSAASWTVPSFMSYFTSLYPSEHRVTNKFVTFTDEEQKFANLSELSPEVKTIAEAFKEHGYITGGFTGDAGVHSKFGYGKGFDVYTDEEAFGSMLRSSEYALEWLDNNRGKKFFMFLHGYDAHGQFSELAENYEPRFGLSGKFEFTPQRQRDLREEGLSLGQLFMEKEEVDDWNSWYDSKIRDADERISNFLQKLDSRGLLDNLLIVVIADHGTEIYEHRRFDHGYSLYNELIRVPMIIKWPQQKIGEVVSSRVRSVDLVPTLFEILGMQKDSVWENQIEGSSLLPLLVGDEIGERQVFSETDYRDYTHKRSYIDTDGWKLIYTLETGEAELYDINADFDEKRNVAQQNPEKVAELKNILFGIMRDHGENPDAEWTVGCLPVYGDQCLDQ
jgi:arylsulfatase A-like enzyme